MQNIVKGILIIIGFIMFFLVGYSMPSNNESVSTDMIRQNVIAELEQKLDSKIKDSLIPFFSEEKRISASVIGEITTVDSQAETLKIQIKNRYMGGDFFSYLNEPNSYTKTVKISNQTKIVKQEMKGAEEFEKERQAYSKDSTGVPPFPYKETEMSIKDLEKDMEITVEAETEINLQASKDIEARKVTIRELF